MNRPEIVTDEHLEFLDTLRSKLEIKSASVAIPYLRARFPDLTREQLNTILYYWLKTFGERHPK